MTGGRKIAESECGNYGEDALAAYKLDDGTVVIERANKDGSSQRWPIGPTDTLKVTGHAFGNQQVSGMETLLVLLPDIAIAHFESNSQWGGTHADEVAAFARAIAAESGCTATIIPTTSPVFPPTPPPPPPPPPAPPPPKPPLALRPGAEILATTPCGDDGDDLLRAIKLPDGSVEIENVSTHAQWTIERGDLLSFRGYNAGGVDRIWTSIDRVRLGVWEQVAGFYYFENSKQGVAEDAVAAFVAIVGAAAGCEIQHREFCWD